MAIQVSRTHSSISGRKISRFEMKKVSDEAVRALAKIGIVMDAAVVHDQVRGLFVGDTAYSAPITTPSAPTPIQFLQTWLPGFVKILTAARKIDDILGIKTVGSWEDQEIVQGIVEPSAIVGEYADFGNIPLSSWNTNFERRTIVRGEMGMSVGLLEEGRAAAMRLNSADEKRQGAAIALEIFRNAIGFYGWNAGNNRTFGFLNDPGLLPYITTSTSGWATATFQQIQADIRLMVRTLRIQSQDQIDPEKIDITFVLPMDKVDFITTTTDFGISVRDWISQTYPKMRIVSCPELQAANSSADVCYMFAEDIDAATDGSSDGGDVFVQLVQTKFMTLGVEKRAKSYVEDYANATAGVMCKRPWAVVRMTGI